MTGVEAAHLALLARWRTAMNLVGPGPLEPHFIDSRGAVGGLGAAGRWADLGSGAGFPGLALAEAYPGAEVVLVESREKRVQFLRRVLAETALANASVHHGRTEDLQPGFDGVISRAYRSPEEYLVDAERLLKTDGVAVVLTAEMLPTQAGWVRLDSSQYPVADGYRVRTVLRRA